MHTHPSPFIHEDFLLGNQTARRLYHDVAAHQPIIDYHCHLPVAEIAGNRQFNNLFEAWLEGDHYKWRAMRANGIAERFCTGDASPKEKFLAWADTVPMTLRNPLYHWTHLELQRYFGISELLNPSTAESIWDRANAVLAEEGSRTQSLIRKMQVEVVCTTDDPTDTLEFHRTLAASNFQTRVLPAFRPDRAYMLDDCPAWNQWVDRLGEVSKISITDYDRFIAALQQRHDFFHAQGCRLSDHGLQTCPQRIASPEEAAQTFSKARKGEAVTLEEADGFLGALLFLFGKWDHAKGWVKQLHLGAIRNVNMQYVRLLGKDTGFDSIGDWPQVEALARYLGALDAENALPKMILYNLNPADNYPFAAMIGNFQNGEIAGKIQWGSGWWFLDQKEGIEWQLNALSHLGLLSRFVGMLTDSRSFLSYPRHEYFRRILCNLLGAEVEAGLLPDDKDLLTDYVERICYRNAKAYFGFDQIG